MATAYFVAGTDTDVGKTLISAALLIAAHRRGLSTQGMKPLASGSVDTGAGLRNADALLLQAHSSVALEYDEVNPLVFAPAIAPHIAARQSGKRLEAGRIAGFCRGALLKKTDFTVIEGVGGWRVPLNERETFADVVRALDMPVILVVGMRLGCVSHAILTAEAIQRDGLTIAGWVANRTDANMSCFDENLTTLQAWLDAPLLGVVPRLPEASPDLAANCLNIEALL